MESGIGCFEVNLVPLSIGASGAIGENYVIWTEKNQYGSAVDGQSQKVPKHSFRHGHRSCMLIVVFYLQVITSCKCSIVTLGLGRIIVEL